MVVCGTSALRDAANRDEFIELVAQRTGLSLEILSGEDEAVWSFRGAVGDLGRAERVAVLDIGGGSTEITIGRGDQIELRHSAQVGAVRLTERYFRSDPPTPDDLTAAERETDRSLEPIDPTSGAGARLVGVAGTVVTLASIAGPTPEPRPGSPFPSHLTLETVERLYSRLSRLSSSAIRPLSPLMEGRADLITAGALILRQVMRRFGFREIRVSEKGLRYGLVAREWERRR
jgi:exopolyphosphatase / guanosine-5'-triphosphate,3'-diphosphate pyrophosphatase